MPNMMRSEKPKRKHRPLIWIIPAFICMIIGLSALSFYYYVKYWPNSEHIAPNFHNLAKPIFYKGQQLELSAIGEQEAVKLPLPVVEKIIDPSIWYEQSSGSVIITTSSKVVQLKTNQLSGMLNQKPINLRFPVEKIDQTVYLPFDELKTLYGVELRESKETGAVILIRDGDLIQWGKTRTFSSHPEETIPLRADPTIKAPIYKDISQQTAVMIWSEQDGWYRVQLTNGIIGYIEKTGIILDHIENAKLAVAEEPYIPWSPVGGKINLTWEQVTGKSPNTAAINKMPGLNVISPTWFHLLDTSGGVLKNLADPAYVKWAHARNYQIWALFSNSFDPGLTSAALSTYENRLNMVTQLINFVQLYHLEGINIDFENVAVEDKNNFTQFIRELTPLLHEQGLVVSVDVTVKSGNEMWSQFYDRQAIGAIVDYMMVMTYDEHWASSPIAGSVASLPWVEQSMVRIMKEDHVPAAKLILGIPFYTRIWTEELKDGKTAVTSKAVSMDAVDKILQERKLTPVLSQETGQNYVEYTEGAKTNKIWIEDNSSIEARVALMKQYDFAGLAAWKRGLEKPAIWDVIQQSLIKRP